MFDKIICGGRGKCLYCNEWFNNVSYHEEHECIKRPKGVEYESSTSSSHEEGTGALPVIPTNLRM